METIRTAADYDTYYPAKDQFKWRERMEQVRHEGGQSLEAAAKVTGRGAAISWLTRQLAELPTTMQMDADEWVKLAQRMYSIAKRRTLPQIMVFVHRVASGDFCQIFGKPNSADLGRGWRAYDTALNQITIRDVQTVEIDTSGAITRAEFDQLDALANAGDTAAQDGMFPPDKVMREASLPILETYKQRAIRYGRQDWLSKIEYYIQQH